jgi:1-aminocyclopropane-1-carboxylate deaminase
LLHPTIMGNKWRKLKYNLLEAEKKGFKSLLTFGGAYSNHIYAVAAAGKEFGFETIGIIRGDELNSESNSTLKFASSMGMKLDFVTRNEYLDKEKLALKFGQNSFILPEGGTNELAIKGVSELMQEIDNQIDANFVCASIGTGGTFAGLINGSKSECKILGFPAIKGIKNINQLIPANYFQNKTNFDIIPDYHFGGYGKYDSELINFMQAFENEHNIPLEQVYNAKLFYGVFDKINRDYFPEKSKIVMVHTGGLQGRIKY